MKKGYYIYVENCGSSGVMNKIKMQMDTFSRHLDIHSIQIPNKKSSLFRKVHNMLPWASFEREYGRVLKQMDNPDFVYIRRTYIDRDYIAFLREIHARWSTCKIIVEQPVYPYDKDMLLAHIRQYNTLRNCCIADTIRMTLIDLSHTRMMMKSWALKQFEQ